MRLLSKNELASSIAAKDGGIFIDPLLREDQIGAISIDLRIGYDFLVSILTRKPAIYLGSDRTPSRRSIKTYFQETRRKLGDSFILYPNQLALATTIEYVSLPPDVFAEIKTRSSYSRLGISVTTTLQPGWRGAVPLELFNHGNTPVELIVGSCICQSYFYKLDTSADYMIGPATRKYYGSVRPAVSKADHDSDLDILSKIQEGD